MIFVKNIDFDQVKEELKNKYHDHVWGDNRPDWFVAEDQSQKDNAHIHVFTDSDNLTGLLLTFTVPGNPSKQHADLKAIKGSAGDSKNWIFSYNSTDFDGDQIETALKGVGVKSGDAKSIADVFYALQQAIDDSSSGH